MTRSINGKKWSLAVTRTEPFGNFRIKLSQDFSIYHKKLDYHALLPDHVAEKSQTLTWPYLSRFASF